MKRLTRACATAAALAVAGAGCAAPAPAGGTPQPVFAMQPPGTESFPAHREEVMDVGVESLHNDTGHLVRLRYVRWVNKPAAAHILNIYAYNYQQLGHGIDATEGNLPVDCPKEFHPRPVGSFTVPPHADSAWFVLIAFTIGKAGIYHLDRVKIGYTTDGHQGWQYQNLNITIRVHNPPWPGPMPRLPKSAIC